VLTFCHYAARLRNAKAPSTALSPSSAAASRPLRAVVMAVLFRLLNRWNTRRCRGGTAQVSATGARPTAFGSFPVAAASGIRAAPTRPLARTDESVTLGRVSACLEAQP
jgi:hypothetical protein